MRRFTLGIFALILSPALSWGNQYKDLPLEEKSKKSDLVVVASVAEITRTGCVANSNCARLAISSRLKGQNYSDVLVMFDGLIAEENPPCCEVGSTYVFFLKRVRGNVYASANGPFGIYPMVRGSGGTP